MAATDCHCVTLNVRFPSAQAILDSGYEGPNYTPSSYDPPLTLKMVEVTSDHDIRGPHPIRDGEEVVVEQVAPQTSRIFYAKIGGRPYVIKRTLNNDSLHTEAARYVKLLQALQGKAVPYFYGFFKGVGERGDCVYCIILEDCGRDEWTGTREPIVNLVADVHNAGLRFYNDEATFIRMGDSFRMMGFGRARFHKPKSCVWDGDIRFGKKYPFREDFGCESLHGILDNYSIWRTWEFSRLVWGYNYKVAKVFPPQELVDAFFPEDFRVNGEKCIEGYERIFLTWLGGLMKFQKKNPKLTIHDYARNCPVPEWRKLNA